MTETNTAVTPDGARYPDTTRACTVSTTESGPGPITTCSSGTPFTENDLNPPSSSKTGVSYTVQVFVDSHPSTTVLVVSGAATVDVVLPTSTVVDVVEVVVGIAAISSSAIAANSATVSW